MASPRVFVSSTYYDLRYVRADLERFERETGFDLVLFERGQVPYEATRALEESCFDEIDKCDIVVSIIGGRSGTPSRVVPEQSISHREVRHAVEQGRQLFVFVERNVHTEFDTYLPNVERASEIHWSSVDSLGVFEFIKYIRELPRNNAMFPFDTSQELMSRLREQLTGLFKTLLQQQRRGLVDASANKLVEAVQTLNNVVEYLKGQQQAEERAMNDIIFRRHPAFAEVQRALGLGVRVIFDNMAELDAWFRQQGFASVAEEELRREDAEEYFFWAKGGRLIGVTREIFVDGSGAADDPVAQPSSRDDWEQVRELVVVREPSS